MGQWKPGESGNPRGRPSLGERWKREVDEAITPERVGRLVARLLAAAEQGEAWAMKLVLDRVWPVETRVSMDARAEVVALPQPQPIERDRALRIVALMRSVGALALADAGAEDPDARNDELLLQKGHVGGLGE